MTNTMRMNANPRDGAAVTATIAFCALAALCEGIDLQAAGVAALGIATEFKPGPDEMGTFFSSSTLGLFFGALIGGRLADSMGRKKVLTASVALFGAFSLLTPFSWDMTSLIWARVLTGLGLGGALPNLIALVSETAREGRQGGAVAMVYAATPFGGAVASLISLVMPASSWRVIFVAGGVLPLVLSLLMSFGLQESVAFRRARLATAGNVVAQDACMSKPGSFLAIFAEGRALRTLLLWSSLQVCAVAACLEAFILTPRWADARSASTPSMVCAPISQRSPGISAVMHIPQNLNCRFVRLRAVDPALVGGHSVARSRAISGACFGRDTGNGLLFSHGIGDHAKEDDGDQDCCDECEHANGVHEVPRIGIKAWD